MPSVRANGLTLSYEEAGAGDPVLMIQGTGEPGISWAAQAGILADRWRCLMPDNRDVGHSTYVAESYTPVDMARDMADMIDALGVGPCHVVGYSLGGATAQELALARPDLVRSVVLLATWARTDGWFAAQMRLWQHIRRTCPDEQSFMDALAPWLFAPKTFATARADALIRDAVEYEPVQRADGWIRQCDADIAHDALDRLGDLRAPALVLVGDDDICTPPRYSRALVESLPEAEMVTLPDAAHMLPFEQPELVARTLGDFFAMH